MSIFIKPSFLKMLITVALYVACGTIAACEMYGMHVSYEWMGAGTTMGWAFVLMMSVLFAGFSVINYFARLRAYNEAEKRGARAYVDSMLGTYYRS